MIEALSEEIEHVVKKKFELEDRYNLKMLSSFRIFGQPKIRTIEQKWWLLKGKSCTNLMFSITTLMEWKKTYEYRKQ